MKDKRDRNEESLHKSRLHGLCRMLTLEGWCFCYTNNLCILKVCLLCIRCLTLSEGIVNRVATLSQGMNEYSNIMFSTNVTDNWVIFLRCLSWNPKSAFFGCHGNMTVAMETGPSRFFPHLSPTFPMTTQYHKWNIWPVKTLLVAIATVVKVTKIRLFFSHERPKAHFHVKSHEDRPVNNRETMYTSITYYIKIITLYKTLTF